MLAAAVVFALFACIDRSDPTAPGSTPNATDDVTVAVKLPVSSLEVGHTVTAAVSAKTASGQPVSVDSIEWSTSDTSVLAVSPVGEVRARKMGSAVIFARWRKKSGKGALSVTDTLPAKVVVSPSMASASVGGHMHLSAAVATITGRALPSHPVKWSSSDTRIVTVSTSGMVTGARAGTVQVIAAADAVSDTATVVVSAASIASLSITPQSSSVESGETVQLDAHAADADGNTLTGRPVGWASSDADIASVSTNGVVTGGKTGTATITATAEGARASATIHVTAGSAHTITVTPGSVGIVAGATQQLTASVDDQAGNGLAANGIAWASANPAVAKVTPSGLVTGVHPGSTTITAVLGDAIGRASVVVSTGAVKTVTVTPASLSLASGGTRQMAVKLVDAVGNVVDADAAWSSSNNAVATVSASGLVTAKQSGSATITAAAGGAKGTAALTVTAGSISSITVTPGSASLAAGETQQLAAKLTDNSGSVITGQTVTWSSSDASIVKVSSSGVASGAHVGRATITATAGGKSGSATFSVAAGPVNSVSITPASGSVQQGKTLQLSAAATDVAGNAVTAHSITWSSSKSSVAAVSSTGSVTGVAVGSATITSTADGTSKTAAITVTAATTSSPPPPPPPPPATTPPPPPPVQTACSEIPHSRLVSVSNGSQLSSALSSAQAGDLIQLADGSYTGSEFRLTKSGTSSARITVCGTSSAVITANGGNDGMKLSNANYATLSGFTIAGGLFGVWVEHSTNVTLQGLTIHGIGQEGIELSGFSSNAQILGNKIYDTGRTVAEYGEGIYVGSANAHWAAQSGGQPDATDNVLIDGNTIGPDVRAEHIDAKEGTHNGIIRNNTFNGAGMIESQGSGESGWPNSWVILQGVGYQVYNNTGSHALSAGFRVVTHGTVQTGLDNVFYNNTFDVGGAAYGFLIQTGSGSNYNGNVVQCNNSVSGESKEMSNEPCK